MADTASLSWSQIIPIPFYLEHYSRHIADNATLRAENASSSTKSQKAQWKKKELKLNVKETTLMTIGRTNNFRIDNEDIKMVASFFILGSTITGKGTRSMLQTSPW